ncbi:MAG: M48 family metalloprotease [Alphaproteobacteria bacterium]|nr:M48 family metalloprotease [Alphaproteobacteria bacterium]
MLKKLAFLICLLIPVSSFGATLINDTETESLLRELVLPLSRTADIPDTHLHIYIVRDDDFNAFVRGGQDVFVNTGLLTQIRTPSAFQAVVAHELGHVLGGHISQMSNRISAEATRTMLIQALGVGLMVAGGNPTLGAGIMAGSSGVAQQSMLAFTRDEERIADNMGLSLMAQSGTDVKGFITVLEQMRDISGALESKINPNRINHPLTSERLNNIKAQISQLSDYTPPSSDEMLRHTSEYERVRAKLIGYLEPASRVFEKYPYSDKSDAGLYARAIANMRSGDLDTAATGTRTLISRHPNNPYFYELLGDIEYQSGNYDASASAYEKSLSLMNKSAPQIETALALVLTARNRDGDNARAIELAKRSLLVSPAPLAYWVLARAYADQGSGLQDWAFAEYYNMLGKTNMAHDYAARAQKQLPKSAPEYLKCSDILSIKTKK